MLTDPEALYTAWQQLKAEKRLRNREAAGALAVSEAELVASAVGRTVTRLEGDLRDLVRWAPELGRVMALTRNEACVHEKTGHYGNVSADGHVGLVLGEGIDLRLFFTHWRHAYAVEDATPQGAQRSLQVYDASGTAVHKLFLKEDSEVAAYRQLVDRFASPHQAPGETVEPIPASRPERADEEVDVEGLHRAWRAMRDTHAFFAVLKRFGVTRPQALRLAEKEFAYATGKEAVAGVLEQAALDRLDIMIFVGNAGCLQIHTGPVRRLSRQAPWLNVLDPDFNLHLREDLIAASWVVTKPTQDGPVTSLEVFDGAGRTVAMLFGKRKPGSPEDPAWRALVERCCPRPD